jgi:hypothetical protein
MRVMKNEDLLFMWAALQQTLRPHVADLVCITDQPGDWRVETSTGRPFLTLRIQKHHVGLYLLPMYHRPEVRPEALNPFLSGKSTFAFKAHHEPPVEALSSLIEACKAFIGWY